MTDGHNDVLNFSNFSLYKQQNKYKSNSSYVRPFDLDRLTSNFAQSNIFSISPATFVEEIYQFTPSSTYCCQNLNAC